MQDYGDCRVAEVVNQVKGTYCMLPKKATPKLAPNPVKDTRDSYVTAATNADAMVAMNISAMQMIERIAELKKLSLLDSYSLASLAMDARIGRIEPGAKTIHNLMPRSLWVKKA
jgi:acetamidase/formamidase